MNIPANHYRSGEQVTIGVEAADASVRGCRGEVARIICHSHFGYVYDVNLADGRRTRVLEPTLRKIFQAGNWTGCAWQPKRAAR